MIGFFFAAMRPRNTREHVMNNHNDPDQAGRTGAAGRNNANASDAAKREPTRSPGDDESKNPVIINREQ
ncbi:MAG: hypothetical protein U1F20_01305 [Lysobacterales bacterium]